MIEGSRAFGEKHFGKTEALKSVSFSAGNGSITQDCLGANGAGKTTCLRIMADALAPDSGNVKVDGALGALLDHIGLYARLTVRENLAYFGQLQGMYRQSNWMQESMTFW